MKARPFLASLLAVLLLVLSLGGAGWWLVWQKSPLQLQHRALVLPRAARFIPRDAPLALHLLSDGREPVGYARAVASARTRRQAAETIERLRDGAFAAAGLDYPDELAGWLAPEISLALFDRPAAGAAPAQASAPGTGDWLLALRSRDSGGARRFVQRFWQTRSLAGTDLQVSSYRGMGLISGRGALVGRQPVPLATALIDDDLLLIASGRGVLEEALDVSQLDELNQAADPSLRAGIERLGPGVALLVARDAAALPSLGLSPQSSQRPLATSDTPPRPLASPAAADSPADPAQPRARLLASLRPEGRALRLEALLERPLSGQPPAALDEAQRRRLLAQAPAGAASLALVQDPAALRQEPLLRGLVDRALLPAPAAGPLPSLIADRAAGPLLSLAVADDWLMVSPAADPAAAAVEAPLAAAGLIPAPLEVDGRPFTVWTRLEAGAGRAGRDGRDRLQAPLEGWRSERDGLAVWGRSLALLEREGDARGARPRDRQLEALERPGAPIQWALDAASAQALLAGWAPWRSLAGLGGGPLDGSIRGLALALEPGGDALRLRGLLELGAGR